MDFESVEEKLNGIEERAQEELYRRVRDGEDIQAITHIIHQIPAIREENLATYRKHYVEACKIYKKASDLDKRLEY